MRGQSDVSRIACIVCPFVNDPRSAVDVSTDHGYSLSAVFDTMRAIFVAAVISVLSLIVASDCLIVVMIRHVLGMVGECHKQGPAE
jgi:hypothetical protein